MQDRTSGVVVEAVRTLFQNGTAAGLSDVRLFESPRVEVLEELKEGDHVLWNPGQIKEGQQVEPAR